MGCACTVECILRSVALSRKQAHLSSGSVLRDKAHECEHGKTSILDLLKLVLLQDLHAHGCLGVVEMHMHGLH